MTGVVLVTGGSGFTGRHFAAAAPASGLRCVALSQDSSQDIPGFERTLSVDIRDGAALREAFEAVQPDYIVHLAAIAFVAHGDVGAIYSTNTTGTAVLLDAAQAVLPDLKKLLIASSANVYGNARDLPITESSPIAPANDYAVSKAAAEWCANLRSGDLPLVVVRPFNYTGAGQALDFLVPKLVRAFRQRDKVIRLGNTQVARDFSDVRDVVAAYLALLAADTASGTYNVCSGTPIELGELIDRLSKLSGHRLTVEVDPDLVRASEISVLYGSDSRLVECIGAYREHTLDDTLRWMLEAPPSVSRTETGFGE